MMLSLLIVMGLSLQMASVTTTSEDNCNNNRNELDEATIQKIAEWSNQLPILVEQDEKRLKNFANYEKIDDVNKLRDEYYRYIFLNTLPAHLQNPIFIEWSLKSNKLNVQ
jgi:hypothetical protein